MKPGNFTSDCIQQIKESTDCESNRKIQERVLTDEEFKESLESSSTTILEDEDEESYAQT